MVAGFSVAMSATSVDPVMVMDVILSTVDKRVIRL